MATVHIPITNIIWLAHSASGRLDIGLSGGIVHLLQRDSEKSKATKAEIARSIFNKVGSVYWVEAGEGLGELYKKLEKHLEIRPK